jgi:Universal stress protein family
VTSGEAGPVIVDFALTRQVDLVVLGSPATMLSEQDLETSTVLQVISGVHCPVLCIPTSRQEKNRTELATESEIETAVAAASDRRANQNRPISG